MWLCACVYPCFMCIASSPYSIRAVISFPRLGNMSFMMVPSFKQCVKKILLSLSLSLKLVLCVYMCVRICICVRDCTCIMHIYPNIDTETYIHTHMHVYYAYISKYAHVYVYISKYTHRNIRTHTRSLMLTFEAGGLIEEACKTPTVT
jgi:hypothetical protein